MTVSEMWDYLTETGIATENELCLITAINGYNEEAMCDVLYVRTGYHSFEQFKEEFLEIRSYIACDEEVLKQAYEESHGNIDLATDFILSQDLADEVVL